MGIGVLSAKFVIHGKRHDFVAQAPSDFDKNGLTPPEGTLQPPLARAAKPSQPTAYRAEPFFVRFSAGHELRTLS
jgi:hypothetical protein